MATGNRMNAQEIAELMHLMGWSQVEMARELNADESTVSRWLNGIQKPSGTASKFMRRLLDEARSTKPPARKPAPQPA